MEAKLVAQIFETADRKRMVGAARAKFQSRGWKVSESKRQEHDFEIQKADIVFTIKCLDASQWNYKSSEKTAQRIQSDSIIERTRAERTLVSIIDFGVSGYNSEAMLQLGCITISPDEIDIVLNLERFDRELPTTLSPRELAMLSGNLLACARFSEAYEQAGDLSAAADWMRFALTASDDFRPGARWRFLGLLIKLNDLPGAEAVAADALARRPHAMEYAQAVERLALRCNDLEKASVWATKKCKAAEKPIAAPTFDDLVKKMGDNTATTKPGAESANLEHARTEQTSWLASIFRGRRERQ
jgi:hypothetical protein